MTPTHSCNLIVDRWNWSCRLACCLQLGFSIHVCVTYVLSFLNRTRTPVFHVCRLGKYDFDRYAYWLYWLLLVYSAGSLLSVVLLYFWGLELEYVWLDLNLVWTWFRGSNLCNLHSQSHHVGTRGKHWKNEISRDCTCSQLDYPLISLFPGEYLYY